MGERKEKKKKKGEKNKAEGKESHFKNRGVIGGKTS